MPLSKHVFLKLNLVSIVAVLLSIFSIIWSSETKAQTVTVNPVEAPGALTNPFMGFRPGLDSYSRTAYPTVIQTYIPWNAIEEFESDTVEKIRDYCNDKWKNLPAANVRVIPRVFIQWNSEASGSWPSDLTAKDWSSPEFKARVVRLVGRLGEVWNNDPRVAWVQTGLIGYWGEQESPVGIGEDGWSQRLGDAFTAAFPNKKFIVRNMGSWPGYNVGVYWDSFGHPGQRTGAWDAIKSFNNQGRYLTDVVEGETAYDWGIGDWRKPGSFASLYGSYWDPEAKDGAGDWKSSPTFTLGNTAYTDNMIDVIRELHCSALGWIAGYDHTIPAVAANAARMQKAFGYRFHLSEFSCDARANPGTNFNFQARVKNLGAAPIYENWPLAVTLIDKNTRQLIWKATIPNVDIRKWQPGHDYSYTTRTYQTPAQEHLISASIPLPATLPVGEYLVGLTILEPFSRTPGVFFAIPNFFKESQTQPLAKIGIGMNATGHTLDGIAFDDLVNDDTRFYTMTPRGPFYTLHAQQSNLGSVSQESVDGKYAADTTVVVTAVGRVGYKFSSWGGVLAGSTENPAIVVMDKDKTISANYVPATTHRLNTTSSNGTITFSPSGGIYNKDTLVTLTATPSTGYVLNSWGGDTSGSSTTSTLVMTGDKNVTANFTPASVPSSFGINCGGPAYTTSEGVVFNADGLWNSGGNVYTRSSTAISNTLDDTLHFTNRWSNSFNYKIPVANDYYEVTLIFSEVYHDAVGKRIFNVAIEEAQVISSLDVFSKVGKNAAYHEKHMVTVNDGTLNILLSSVVDNANISAIKITSRQKPNTFTLVSNASNGAVSSSPAIKFHENGSLVTLTATPSTGYRFDSWSDDLSGTTNPASLSINGNKTVRANFVPITTTYSLDTAATNGTIHINPFGGIYYPGTPITLTASPAAGYEFTSWGGALNGSVNPSTITMGGDKTVTANFEKRIDITKLSAWVQGLSNPKASGPNRLMIVMVMGEHANSDFKATEVRYGNQRMTLQTQRFTGASNRTYAALFTLDEVGVNLADSGTIAVTWGTIASNGSVSTIGAPSSGHVVYSMLLSEVDQANPVGAKASNGLPSVTSISTTPLNAGIGDMVVACGATEANTDITFGNGFTLQFEANPISPNWGDATGGIKLGTGVAETPGFNQSASGRMVLCAMVVKKAAVVDLFNTWSNGAGFDVDTNKDGIENGLAWVLGASSPSASAASLLHVITQAGDNLQMTFKMLPASQRNGAKVFLEHSSDLGASDPWSQVAVPDSTGVVGPVTFAVTGTNPLTVVATISSSQAASGRLFGLIKVER